MRKLPLLLALFVCLAACVFSVTPSPTSPSTCTCSTTIFSSQGTPLPGVAFFLQVHSSIIGGTLVQPASFNVTTDSAGVARVKIIQGAKVTISGQHPSFAKPVTVSWPATSTCDLAALGANTSTPSVFGPPTSTDNAIVRFDGLTGGLVQNSVGILSDAGALSGVTMNGNVIAAGTVAAARLGLMTGDSGSGGASGAVPAPGSGDTAAGKFLRADGTWQVVATGSFVDTSTNQSVAGNKTFTGLTKLGSGTTVNDSAWSNTGATGLMLQGADSSNGSPSSSGNPSLVLQTWRTGGSVGVGVFGYELGFISSGAGGVGGDTYTVGIVNRWNRNMTGFADGDYFQTGIKSHVVLSPTNKPAGANLFGYGAEIRAERTVAGIRAVGLQSQADNSTATRTDFDGQTLESTISLNVAGGGSNYNSLGIQIDTGTLATSFATGIYFKRNSVRLYASDYTGLIDDVTGTFTFTNGSGAATGLGTALTQEMVKGDRFTADGVTWYKVTVAPASDTALAFTPVWAGSTGGGVSIDKSVFPVRLSLETYFVAGPNNYTLMGMDVNQRMRLDTDGRSIYAGTTPTRMTDATGSMVIDSPLSLSNGLNSNLAVESGTALFARVGGPSGAFSIGGFVPTCRVIYIFNSTGQTMTIVNEDASSTAANRIATLTGGNVVLRAGQSFATIAYSPLDSRWVLTATN